jgi:hypothetical protein
MIVPSGFRTLTILNFGSSAAVPFAVPLAPVAVVGPLDLGAVG